VREFGERAIAHQPVVIGRATRRGNGGFSMSFKRIVLGLCALSALFNSAPSLAVSVAERSPFTQGQWWDPTRSGNGFEIFSTADQVAVVWFAYSDAGRPIWYTANGSLDSLGKQAWPLLQHRWSSAGRESPVVVGSLRLNVHHPESAEVVWELGGTRGTWAIQPLIVSGVINEIDHSGLWFDPSNSGWGLSLAEQGDLLGGILYTYDPSGVPTWIAGFNRRDQGSVAFLAYTGTCPACAYRPSVGSSVGNLSIEMRSETELTVRSSLNMPMATGVKVDGAQIIQLGRPASWRAADRQLANFDNASALNAYLAAGMMHVQSPSSEGGFSAGPPPVAFSFTNLQESGVDEADLVKSNGVYLYTYAHDSNGNRLPAVRVAKVGNDGATLDVRGSVFLRSGPATPVASAGLFLHGDYLVSVTGTQATSYIASPWALAGSWMRGVTQIEVLSTSTSDIPVTRWRAEIDGHVVASRRIGERLYVVSRFVPYLAGFVYGTSYPPAVATNQQLLASTPLSELLPKVRIDGGDAAAAVAVTAVHAPPQGARKPMADMILITAIDLGEPRIAQTLAIVGSVETVYASSTSLFVASSRYEARDTFGLPLQVEPSLYLTDVHQIRLGTDAMSIVGSASIEGILGHDVEKAAFRLSEHQGRLRAVTSSANMWGSTNKNRLTILEPSTLAPGLLKTVSYLPNAKRPQPLGKPYEVLYGTRFLGDRLYAVTFKQIDPLYIVDLADSTDPRITGALELPGFSDYLHPLPNGLLLGFGKDARPADVFGDGPFAWYQGLQLTLFDVGNADQPRELQRVLMGKRGSESALLRNHHAFSALMQSDGTGSIAIPARIHDGPVGQWGSGDSAYYPWQHSGLMRFELRGTSASDARLVQLPSLITHSAAQLSAPYDDAASNGARSVLFRNGTIMSATANSGARTAREIRSGRIERRALRRACRSDRGTGPVVRGLHAARRICVRDRALRLGEKRGARRIPLRAPYSYASTTHVVAANFPDW
jgi:uncharacterized secreted protein with C-terminal beta-propeller domain